MCSWELWTPEARLRPPPKSKHTRTPSLPQTQLLYLSCYTHEQTVCLLMLPGTNVEASNSRIWRVSFVFLFFLCIVWCAYLYCGFILIGPPSEELGVNVGVWSLHLQRVQAFILIVHRLKERHRQRERWQTGHNHFFGINPPPPSFLKYKQ